MSTEYSIVEWRSEHEGYRCGYCHSPNTNFSHGMWAHSLTVQDYQHLIDRGWRRSGKYVYKPTMKKTCCPMYPIRCSALDFKLSKSHRQVINKVNKFINYGIRPSQESADDTDNDVLSELVSTGSERADKQTDRRINTSSVTADRQTGTGSETTDRQAGTSSVTADRQTGTNSETADRQTGTSREAADRQAGTNRETVVQHTTVHSVHSKAKQAHSPRTGVGLDPSKPLCKKAKERRREKLREKNTIKPYKEDADSQSSRSKTEKYSKMKSKTLEEYLDERISNPLHKLEVKLVESEPKSKMLIESLDESHSVYVKYQTTVHHDEPHEVNMAQFTRFLVDSPLTKDGNVNVKYGSYHQQYWLDGQLIAVGVIDILPCCVSSVYLYYDPNFSFLSLGTYSALQEIALTRLLHSTQPSIIYYYLGFYIHSCPKMRYKGQYSPSSLCCPESYKWIPLSDCIKKLSENKYSRFASQVVCDDDENTNVDDVLCLYQNRIVTYGEYRRVNARRCTTQQVDSVRLFASLIGIKSARSVLLFRK